MSERLVRIEDLAVGFTPDLPDQQPILWEDGRGILFMDKALQPMPGQIPLVSTGVGVNALCGTGDLIFLGTSDSVLTYSKSKAELNVVTPRGIAVSTPWSFQAYGNWMFATQGGKLWVWKPQDLNEFILGSNGEPTEERNPKYWPHKDMQEVTEFTKRGFKAHLLLKCKNFLVAVCKDSILWCDDDNPEVWAPELGNMAGDLFIRDIQSDIVAGAAVDNFMLLATKREVVKVSYISRPYIFGYNLLYKGAGCWNVRSLCVVNKSIFGFGPNGIWTSDGLGITFIDNGRIGTTINEELDLNRTGSCFCGPWGILQHVFFFIPVVDESNKKIRCFGFNLENNTWTMIDWDRFCSWEQYWVSSDGILYMDDLKNSLSQSDTEGKLPLNATGESLAGWDCIGWDEAGFGGIIWLQE